MTFRGAEDARLRAELEAHATLQDVLDWSGRRGLPPGTGRLLKQDEYSHDLVLPAGDGRHVVHDTT